MDSLLSAGHNLEKAILALERSPKTTHSAAPKAPEHAPVCSRNPRQHCAPALRQHAAQTATKQGEAAGPHCRGRRTLLILILNINGIT